MSVTVSLLDDVAFVDSYAESHRENNRSAVIRKAIRLLREQQLADDYRAALTEWHESGGDEVWDAVTGDGIDGESHETG